jgi:hypothetical protein
MAYGTLKADVIQSDTAGTPPQFNDGNGTQTGTLCRAWGNFTLSGTTLTTQASFNVSSITRVGVGNYTVNFTNAFADNKYSVVFGARQSIIGYASVDVQSTTNFTMYGSSAGSANELTIGNFAVFR